jgi:hypothetical protein
LKLIYSYTYIYLYIFVFHKILFYASQGNLSLSDNKIHFGLIDSWLNR